MAGVLNSTSLTQAWADVSFESRRERCETLPEAHAFFMGFVSDVVRIRQTPTTMW